MLLLWIFLIIVIIIVVKYIYLIVKRCHLIRKIRKQVKKQNGSLRYYRNPFVSLFKHDCKADISLQFENRIIDVSVVTTPFRRVRYHFDVNNYLLELIIERRAIYVQSPSHPRPTATSSSMDRVYTIRKYKIKLEDSDNGNQKFVILHPAPRSTSKADGVALTTLYNNDNLTQEIKVCGLKYFVENVFE
ncbi:MAG: hypothetical protein IKB41_00895 [Clostridia bacterium]|nr:hypothetical protein [Clostridia bacterium]